MFDEDDGALSFRLDRESPYSFHCRRCGVCCANKRLTLSPSERKRLAVFLGVPEERFTTDFLDSESGELLSASNGDCVFLEAGLCRVHPVRPLVCRLFPLGLLRDETGREAFGVMPRHPDCLGFLGTDGTVGGDLNAQGSDVLLEQEKESRPD